MIEFYPKSTLKLCVGIGKISVYVNILCL